MDRASLGVEDRARTIAGTLKRTSQTLEKSATLADAHARRLEPSSPACEREHEAAERARRASAEARRQAEAWLELSRAEAARGDQPAAASSHDGA